MTIQGVAKGRADVLGIFESRCSDSVRSGSTEAVRSSEEVQCTDTDDAESDSAKVVYLTMDARMP
jgi:hypothetical protein